jgi:hypothetical protein
VIAAGQPRLVIAERPTRRDHLHGAWWPRSTQIAVELGPMLTIVGTRFRSVFGVVLNRDEWPVAGGSWHPLGASSVKVSWYGLPESNLAILHCGDQWRIWLLVLPPDTPEAVALAATFMACSPGNSLTTAETLVRAHDHVGHTQTLSSRLTRSLRR